MHMLKDLILMENGVSSPFVNPVNAKTLFSIEIDGHSSDIFIAELF
jgi:hypothetical protein